MLVEPPGGGPLRRIPPFWQRRCRMRERSLFFWFYAAGKRGITLDCDRPDGAALLAPARRRAPTS